MIFGSNLKYNLSGVGVRERDTYKKFVGEVCMPMRPFEPWTHSKQCPLSEILKQTELWSVWPLKQVNVVPSFAEVSRGIHQKLFTSTLSALES